MIPCPRAKKDFYTSIGFECREGRSHLDLLQSHGGVVQQVSGPVHLAELTPADLLLDLEVGQGVVAHVRLQWLLGDREGTHTTQRGSSVEKPQEKAHFRNIWGFSVVFFPPQKGAC